MIGPRRRMQGRIKPWVPASLVLGIGAVALVWFLGGLPVEIKRIRISGLDSISETQLSGIGGIEAGMKVGRARAREIKKTLLKHPLVMEASVDAGVTGTLHIKIRERIPFAWLENLSCAVGEDGVLLASINKRAEGWLRLDGLRVERGRIADMEAMEEAAGVDRIIRDCGEFGSGVWARRAGYTDSWLWLSQGKTVRFSRPVPEEEINRLQSFKKLRPQAWSRARVLDLRFADRVVVKR